MREEREWREANVSRWGTLMGLHVKWAQGTKEAGNSSPKVSSPTGLLEPGQWPSDQAVFPGATYSEHALGTCQVEEAEAAASCPPSWCRWPLLLLDSYLLPLSGGSWLPTLDWALLSLLATSLSSASWKRSRKESGAWSSGWKCLAAQVRSERMRRGQLEG